jgi:outer membrane protein TolC
MKLQRKPLALLLLIGFGHALAATPAPELPPDEIVARVLRGNPGVQAAASQIRVEEANRSRLEAGNYEWNVRLGGQQRRVRPASAGDEQFNEWNAAIERPLRLPGKGALDAELGAGGVALAETAYGDTLHESSRSLLKLWFAWLKESASASQWREQAALLGKQNAAVTRRQQLGDAARLDSVQSEAALAQAEAQLAQASVRQQTAGEDLRRRFPGLPVVAPAALANLQPSPAARKNGSMPCSNTATNCNWPARKRNRPGFCRAQRPTACPTPRSACRCHANGRRGAHHRRLCQHSAARHRPPGDSDAALAMADGAARREAAANQKITPRRWPCINRHRPPWPRGRPAAMPASALAVPPR